MAILRKHIIRNQVVEVEFENHDGIRDTFEFNEHLSDVCRNKLLPAIEKLFDAKSVDHQIISIDNLQIDAGILEKEDWENRFVNETIKRLEEFLDNLLAGRGTVEQDQDVRGEGVRLLDEENNSQAILHYFKHGVLPWYSSIKSQSELTSSLSILVNDDPGFQRELGRLAISNMIVFDRMVMQLTNEAIIKVLAGELDMAEISELYGSWSHIFEVLQIRKSEQKTIFFRSLRSVVDGGYAAGLTESVSKAILNSLKKGKQELLIGIAKSDGEHELTEREEQILKSLLKGNGKNENTNKVTWKKHDDGDKKTAFFEENPVYVSNAGLVLLHPFFSRLFANIGYTKKDDWLSEELHQRSLVLCQYLITGIAEYAEFELLLNKIMTGYPVDESLPSDIILSDFEKNEAQDLLKSVIKHWSVLKNTSVQGLQQTFLKRDGKVVKADTGWLLQVEQKPFDILLDKMPWGFSTIKTPWMDEILGVEWT